MTPANQPLLGLRVLVTRTQAQSANFADNLRDLGAEVIEVPMLAIGPPESWTALDDALRDIASYNWLIFASVNAVRSFFDRADFLAIDPVSPAVSIATIGPATAQALEHYGHHGQYQPSRFIAEHFVEEFPGYPNLEAVKALWPRGDGGRSLIRVHLSQAGATINEVTCYRSKLPDNASAVSCELATLLRQKNIDVITLASGQTTRNLLTIALMTMERDEISSLLAPITFVTIGPETSATAESCGLSNIEQAKTYTTEGMVQSIASVAQRKAEAKW